MQVTHGVLLKRAGLTSKAALHAFLLQAYSLTP
jgi:hypothetical protein